MKKIIIKSLNDFDSIRNKLGDIVSLDTETTSLDYNELEITGISLCDGNLACYIDFTSMHIDDEILIMEDLGAILELKSLVIFHNAPFDLKVLFKEGISCTEDIYCTMTAIHLLNENKSYALKDCAQRVLKVPEDQIKSYKEVEEFGHSDVRFYDYAMNDAIWTYQLWEKTASALIKYDLEELFYEIEMPFQFVLRDLEVNGIYLDKKQVEEYNTQLSKIIFDSQTTMLKELNINWMIQKNFVAPSLDKPTLRLECEIEFVSPINFNSTKQLAEILMKRFDCELPTTDKGNYQVDDTVIQKYKDSIPFIYQLERLRQANKLKGTYIKKFSECEHDRYIGSFNNCGTVTGRISSNFQQFPKEMSNDLGINLRNCIVAPPGKNLIVSDYSGQELRGLAHVAQDKVMIDAFNKNKDLHLTTANRCFELGIPEEELYEAHENYKKVRKEFDKDRYNAKNKINFPIAYGTTEYGIANSLGVSTKKAKEFLDKFFETYPGVETAIKSCGNLLREQGFVRTELGRCRRLNSIYSSNKFNSGKAKRQAFNFLIQGLFADVLRIATARCLKLCYEKPDWGLKLILLVHDEIVFEINKEYTEKAVKAIKEIMEQAYELSVELPVEISYGKIYGEIK